MDRNGVDDTGVERKRESKKKEQDGEGSTTNSLCRGVMIVDLKRVDACGRVDSVYQ